MARKLNPKDFKCVLIVEGYSDLLFFAEVLEAIGKQGTVFIKEFGGKEDLVLKLEDFITPLLLAEKTKIAVIADADGNAAGTFTSLQNKLQQITGQTVPAAGSWTGGTPDIGIFITPDGTNAGEIETLVWRAWSADPANSAAKICIEQYRDCMTAAGFNAKSPDKGLLSSLLAIRYDEDPRLGPGARTNVFDLNHSEFTALRSFLARF